VAGFRPRFFLGLAEVGLSDDPCPAPGREDLSGGVLELGPGDSHHAARVLRLQPGDTCEVVLGAAVYAATVWEAGDPIKVRLTARLDEEEAGARYRCRVGLVQALARPSLVDLVIEKGTEVGSGFFILVGADRSPRHSGRSAGERVGRWCRIALEAAKQSKQVEVPSVEAAESIDAALSLLEHRGALSLVLQPAAETGLYERLEPLRVACPAVALWVGPEGGWSAAESALFETRGVEPVRLGRSVLRTETAGPVAVAAARLALRDW